jgi:23S rRNA pseudouridine2605 synthase
MKRTIDIPLVRFLAMTGFGSRRVCDDLIKTSRVRVNDALAGHGVRVTPGVDHVQIDGKTVEYPPVFLYILLYKPRGYLVSDSDPENRPLAKNLLPDYAMRLFPVGRLDFQTEGAILYTNDGLFANRIAHPRNQIPKTYLAKVRNIPTEATLQRWRSGIRDQKQLLRALDVKIEKITRRNAWLKVTLTGGVNRQVRRMGTATGHPVVKLIRLSIGHLNLGSLNPGDHRELHPKEIHSLLHFKPSENPPHPGTPKRIFPGTRKRILPGKNTKPSVHRQKGKRHDTKTKNRRSK